MAATAIPAAPAAASEPDAEQEGSADEKETGQTGDAAPGFEEGRQDTDLPVDEGVELPASGDGGEVEQAPEHESQPQERGQDEPVPGPDAPTSRPAPAPLPPIPVPHEPPALDESTALEDPQGPSGRPLDRNESRSSPETLRRTPGPTAPLPPPAGKAPAGDAAPPSPPTGQPGSAAGPAPAADPGPVPTGEPPGAPNRDPRDTRTHTVRPGECLWSIAHDQIGSDATPAQVARLVNRLWNLNRERIGTGEPDLLMVGTELRLP